MGYFRGKITDTIVSANRNNDVFDNLDYSPKYIKKFK